MALAANANWVIEDVDGSRPVSMIVKSASVVYNTALCTHDSTTGEVKPFSGTETDRFVGWHFGDAVTGNAAAPRNRAMIRRGGFIVRALTVAGVANNATDYGALVYAADDGTYTLTSTGNKLVGRGVADDRRAAGQLWVYFFPIADGVTA